MSDDVVATCEASPGLGISYNDCVYPVCPLLMPSVSVKPHPIENESRRMCFTKSPQGMSIIVVSVSRALQL